MPEICFDLPKICPSYKDKILELLHATTDIHYKSLQWRNNGSSVVLAFKVDREPSEIENYVIQNIRRTTSRLACRSFPKVRLSGYLPYWELL